MAYSFTRRSSRRRVLPAGESHHTLDAHDTEEEIMPMKRSPPHACGEAAACAARASYPTNFTEDALDPESLFSAWVAYLHESSGHSGNATYSLLESDVFGKALTPPILIQDKKDEDKAGDEKDGEGEEKDSLVEHDEGLVTKVPGQPRTIAKGVINSETHKYKRSELKYTAKTQSVVRQWIRMTSRVKGLKPMTHIDGWDKDRLSSGGALGGDLTFPPDTGKDAGFLTYEEKKKKKKVKKPTDRDTPGFYEDWIEKVVRVQNRKNTTVYVLYEFLTLLCKRTGTVVNKKTKWSKWETVSYETWWVFFTIKIVNGEVNTETDGGKVTSPAREAGKGKPRKDILNKLGLDKSLHGDTILVEPGSEGLAKLSVDCNTEAP
jgi:hypothetical protein